VFPFREDKIFTAANNHFDEMALEIFRFQAANNPVYKKYIEELRIDPEKIKRLSEVPFLPIEFFKTHPVQTTDFQPAITFESSGTTQAPVSRHHLKDIALYKKSFTEGFTRFYGQPSDWCIIGLLPSYLERKNSSLVFMVSELIGLSKHPGSNFYLHEFGKLRDDLRELTRSNQQTLLIGVSFALLDFAEEFPMPLQSAVVMETGGMKGRREEMTREELHNRLKESIRVSLHTFRIWDDRITIPGLFRKRRTLRTRALDESFCKK
jgi:phenylacetate-coenzyme A ligase PaaK-like adenylate-forming protein